MLLNAYISNLHVLRSTPLSPPSATTDLPVNYLLSLEQLPEDGELLTLEAIVAQAFPVGVRVALLQRLRGRGGGGSAGVRRGGAAGRGIRVGRRQVSYRSAIACAGGVGQSERPGERSRPRVAAGRAGLGTESQAGAAGLHGLVDVGGHDGGWHGLLGDVSGATSRGGGFLLFLGLVTYREIN